MSKSWVTSSTTYLFPVCTDRLLRKHLTFSSNGVHWNFIFWAYQALIFIDLVVKINGSYYRNTLLRQHLLPAIPSISGPFFTFQQDNALCSSLCTQNGCTAAVGRDSGLHSTAVLYPRKRRTLWTSDFNTVIVRLRTNCSCTVIRLCDLV